MRVGEFLDAVRSYGVSVPRRIASERLGPRALAIIGAESVGHGSIRFYTPTMVRRLVAWLLIQGITGDQFSTTTQLDQRFHAMRLLAAAPEGWIIMSEGGVSWSLVPPVRTLRSRCAVAIPVPEWRH